MGRVASVSGRYYAMDRDKRWDRVSKAYNTMVDADAPRFDDPIAAIKSGYAQEKYDEFIPPAIIGNTPIPTANGQYRVQMLGDMENGDGAAGQSAALVNAVKPAAQIIADIMAEAARIFNLFQNCLGHIAVLRRNFDDKIG